MYTAVALCLALFPAFFTDGIDAATPPPQAQCDPTQGFGWATNSLGQDPCTVARALGGPCAPSGVFVVPPLPSSNSVYRGPTVAEANQCLCNSVYYSALQLCAACQGRTQDPWSAYITNCSTVYLPVYPETIPPGTAVPAWAYDDVSQGDSVNITLARSQVALPESTSVPKPSNTGPSTPSTPAASGHKSNHAGAIAGGVIGGLVLIALAIGGVFLILRKRRRPHVMDLTRDEPTPSTVQVYGHETPKLYNPNDPSTFPSSPVNSSVYAASQQQPSYNYSYTHNEPQRPVYTGAAEI